MGKEIAVIMGNGPSLNDMPRELLTQYDTYGMNYAKYQPKFYICIDDSILKHHVVKIFNLAKKAETAYLCHIQKDWPNPYTYQLYSLPNVELVGRDRGVFKSEDLLSGATATYVALKLAYYGGYDEVWLWGVDFNREWKHYTDSYPESDEVVGEKRDLHMSIMLKHYRLAAKIYQLDGRRILNFSAPSPLDGVFWRATEDDQKALARLPSASASWSA